MYTKMPCIFNGVGFSTGAGLGQKISRAVACIASAIPVIPAVRPAWLSGSCRSDYSGPAVSVIWFCFSGCLVRMRPLFRALSQQYRSVFGKDKGNKDDDPDNVGKQVNIQPVICAQRPAGR